MRVLVFVTQFYRLGGAERLGVELAEELNARGIRADIVSMYSENLSGTAAKMSLFRRGIPAVHFLGLEVQPSMLSLVRAIYKLKRLLREHHYDLVETSMVMPTIIATWATYIGDTRHIAGVHHAVYKNLHVGLKYMFWRFTVRNSRQNSYYAISKHVERYWLAFSRTKAKHTRVIYNSIPDESFDVVRTHSGLYSELNIPSQHKVIIFVGRMLKSKGIDTALEGLGPILKQEKLHLVFVGSEDQLVEGFYDDEADLLLNMREYIVQSDLQEQVHFLGQRADVSQLLAASNVLVHPARIEGFGLVLVEAMAVGLPIVATNIGGIPEVLADTDNILVPPDNPTELLGAVLKVLSRSEAEQIEFKKRNHVRAEDFRTSIRVDAIVQLIDDISE
jgi:glycosyltransferase involved in cell wall biosynthesis